MSNFYNLILCLIGFMVAFASVGAFDAGAVTFAESLAGTILGMLVVAYAAVKLNDE
jgi:hypothetical protein